MALSAERLEECNRLLFEAVNESSVSLLKFAKLTYSPVELLTSLTQCNEKGVTPLVVAIKGKNVCVIDKLVTWLLKLNKQDFQQISSVVIDQLSHKIPIMEIIDYLIKDLHWRKGRCPSDHLEFIAQVFIKSTSYNRQDKIIALELIGASLIFTLPHRPSLSEDLDNLSKFFGLECWRDAMILRSFQPILLKIPNACVSSASSSVVFESAVELMSEEELKLLQEDFERNYLPLHARQTRLPCFKRMQIQALLVIRRISSELNNGPYWLYLKCLLKFGECFSHDAWGSGVFNSVADRKLLINILLLILEEMNGFDPKLLSRKLICVFTETISLLSIYFIRILDEVPGIPGGREEISYGNLLTPTKFISTIAELFPAISADYTLRKSMMTSVRWLGQGSVEYIGFAELVLRFLYIVDSVSSQMTKEEQQKLEEYYTSYIHRFFPEGTTTVLHVAVQNTIWSPSINRFLQASTNTIKLILKLGADPNAVDMYGHTPLHLLTEQEKCNLIKKSPIYQVLMDAGSHLDIARKNGDTVPSMLKEYVKFYRPSYYRRSYLIVHPFFESLMNAIFPLSCYCARVIRRLGILFDRLPPSLQAFVSLHSAKGTFKIAQFRKAKLVDQRATGFRGNSCE